MRQLLASVFAVGMLLSVPAAAADLEYNYVDFGFISVEPDGGGADFDGLGLRGSFLVNPEIFVIGEFTSASAETGFGDIDRTDLAFGAGYRHALNPSTDVYGSIEYLNVEVDPAFDDDGLRLSGGVRVAMSDRLELRGALQYIDLTDSDTVLSVGAQYQFMPKLAGFFELREGDNFGGYFIGGRYSF
ncbi:MAG: outer membrane beta-barrel protein [Gammaproteobacteria bacterium]|nr:outer membrane beta-barrel protein [Gammaproteobacteria bacterium]